MAKFFKHLLIFIIIQLIIVFTYNRIEYRPVKLENFSSAEEIEKFLDDNYLGKDADEILDDFSKSGIRHKSDIKYERGPHYYNLRSHSDKLKDYKKYEKIYYKHYSCEYTNNFISANNFTGYDMTIFVDNNNKVFLIEVWSPSFWK